MNDSFADIIRDGLWRRNVGLVQLLGLCPLLAVSTSFIYGLGLGLATTAVLLGSNIAVSSIRRIVPREIRIPAFVMIIASLVTAVELLTNAYLHELYRILGIFIPLIVTNCAIIGRAEAFASRNGIVPSALDGLMTGLGFTLALVLLGSLREIVGSGTLFANADLLFGPWAAVLELTLIPAYGGFVLALLPPGAFFGLGLLIALKNVIERRAAERVRPAMPVAVEP
ncbi:MAG: electron transport complex subunit E [Gammaproteobacteria bacterium]|nr:electron transport complex subunit E [Gammaproteobacteria bacterium]